MKKELNRKRERVHELHLVLPEHSSWDDWMTEVRALLRHLVSFLKGKTKRRPKRRFSKRQVKRFQVKPLLRDLSVTEKIELGNRVYHHMVNNPDFASVTPSPEVLIAVVHDLVEAHYDVVHENTTADRLRLKERVEVFDGVFKAVARQVDEIAHGRESVYRSAGMETKRK